MRHPAIPTGIKRYRSICNPLHIALFLLTCLLAGPAFLGCRQPSSSEPPTLQLLPGDGIDGDTVLDAGQAFSLRIQAEGLSHNLTQLLIRSTGSDGTQVWLDSGFNAPTLDHLYHGFKGLDSLEHWEVIVRDRQSERAEFSFDIRLGQLTFRPVTHLSLLRMSTPSHPDSLCFLSLRSGRTFTPYEGYTMQDSADLIYYYGPEEHTLASPGANVESGVLPAGYDLGLWGTRHTARFKPSTLTTGDLAGMVHDSLLIAAYGAGDGKRKSKYMSPGQVISFINWDGRLGLVAVDKVSGTLAGETEIEIWLQAE